MSGPLSVSLVVAPDWSVDPVGWCVWFLCENGHVYREFRRLVDDMRRSAGEGVRLSADGVCHVIRWNSRLKARGDVVAINNNAAALMARLYLEERPEATVFDKRESLFERLSASEWERLMVAFEPLRVARRRSV